MDFLSFRKETLREKLYWNCDASKKDQMICVLSKTHNLWLRGIIEKTCSNNDVIFSTYLIYTLVASQFILFFFYI